MSDAPAARPDGDYTDGAAKQADTHVLIAGDERLEGVLQWPEGGDLLGGVVIAHPYPPHGATMALPVVYRIAQSCRREGLASLRFNFRGVGRSSGTFSGTEEYRDVLAAADYLRGRLRERQTESASEPLPLALAGYSFGSIMAARAVMQAGPVRALVLVGFAVAWEFMPEDTLSRLAGFAGPVLAVCAEHDDVAAPAHVERALSHLGLDYTLDVVERADHFLAGRDREVGEQVAAFLTRVMRS